MMTTGRMLWKVAGFVLAAGFTFTQTAAAAEAAAEPATDTATADVPAAEPAGGSAAATGAVAADTNTTTTVAAGTTATGTTATGTAAPGAFEFGTKPPAVESFKIENGTGSLRLGVLFQPQFEAIGGPVRDSAALNLFVRRTRILLGVTLFKSFEFFFDTDFPDLFKADASGARRIPGLNIQDAFGTVKVVDDLLKIDVGYMLPPTSHNGLQGAGTLYGWDYYANTFRHSDALNSGGAGSPVGRDLGLQFRGLVGGGLVEYRAGVFQGLRVPELATQMHARNYFRLAGRVQVNLFDAETGFFYGGTYLGAKRILSLGASLDIQQFYRRASGDVFVDLPLGPGVLTAQVNLGYWNGGRTLLPAPPAPNVLREQTALMAEAGYLINALHLSPIVRFENRWVVGEDAAVPDELRIGGGVAFWPYGHNINVKAFLMNIQPTPSSHSYLAFNLQTQLYAF
jgi:hypothetical protein